MKIRWSPAFSISLGRKGAQDQVFAGRIHHCLPILYKVQSPLISGACRINSRCNVACLHVYIGHGNLISINALSGGQEFPHVSALCYFRGTVTRKVV